MIFSAPSRLDTRGVRVVTNVGRDTMDAGRAADERRRLVYGKVVWS